MAEKPMTDMTGTYVSLGVRRETLEAIQDRVLCGVDHGGFVENVATLNWEKAAFTADASNLSALGWIIRFRYSELPHKAVDLN